MNQFPKKHLPWISWGAFIIFLISIPGKDLPVLSEEVDTFQPDKLVHVALFLVFVFLLLRGFHDPSSESNGIKDLSFYAILAGILLGGSTEIFQHFCIAGRSATLKDFLFNTVGCILGWIVYLFYTKRRQNFLQGEKTH